MKMNWHFMYKIIIFIILMALVFIACILFLPIEYSLWSLVIAPITAWIFIPRSKNQTRGLRKALFNLIIFCVTIGGVWSAYGWYNSLTNTSEEIAVIESGISKNVKVKVVITGHNAGLYPNYCMSEDKLLLRIPKGTRLDVIKEKFVWGGGIIGFPMYYVKYGETVGWMSSMSTDNPPDFVRDDSKKGKCQVRRKPFWDFLKFN